MIRDLLPMMIQDNFEKLKDLVTHKNISKTRDINSLEQFIVKSMKMINDKKNLK